MPDLNVIKLGGQSIIDRGGQGSAALWKRSWRPGRSTKLLVMTGGGTRSRHAYAIALDLGMPTGRPGQAGRQHQRAERPDDLHVTGPLRGIKVGHDDVVKLPAYLALGAIPVMHAMPPYGLWEEPQSKGRIPPHRTDVGAYLTAEVSGQSAASWSKTRPA
jgi:molybdenum storage protein